MSQGTTILLGAIAGFSILLGLPVARLRGLPRSVQGFLNALATGILVFLVWDVIKEASEPVEQALVAARTGGSGEFVAYAALFAGGMAVGLLSLVYANRAMTRRYAARRQLADGPGAAIAAPPTAIPQVASGRWLAMMIAIGMGLHNLSEGLAIGASAASGAISFATVLVIGFALHNVTEGFGVAAPMASDDSRPSWGFLLLAGLIAGGPTLVGTVIGYSVINPYVFVLFLTLAAGALIYVITEMVSVGKRMNSPVALGWGLLLGFLAGYGTDLILTAAGS
ncbi:MAG: zinc transporter, family [Chloroflexota bacterium]|jgi:ZIP family zinc transporter|nr:zinc transporter, family [Chloroflexota bacterium]